VSGSGDFGTRHHRVLAYLTTTALDRVRLVDGEAEAAPGVRAFQAGCRHRHSMAIAIETAKGSAVIADSIFCHNNVGKEIPLGILESLFECRISSSG
jgi:hypothetical protein